MWAWLKRTLVRMWRIRGGGFYGLGFVITFVILQIQALAGDVAEAESAEDFVRSQVFEYVFRYLGETIAIFVQSFLWPLLFLSLIGPWGIPTLIAGFLSFERWVKPVLSRYLPEIDEVEPGDAR